MKRLYGIILLFFSASAFIISDSAEHINGNTMALQERSPRNDMARVIAEFLYHKGKGTAALRHWIVTLDEYRYSLFKLFMSVAHSVGVNEEEEYVTVIKLAFVILGVVCDLLLNRIMVDSVYPTVWKFDGLDVLYAKSIVSGGLAGYALYTLSSSLASLLRDVANRITKKYSLKRSDASTAKASLSKNISHYVALTQCYLHSARCMKDEDRAFILISF